MENLQKTKTGYLTETKVSKSRNGKSKSYTYSTVIPKVIVNKFGLDKGHKLYWDINELSISITPQLPEEESIQAGYDIFKDMLENGNHKYYTGAFSFIKRILNQPETPDDEKVKTILDDYKQLDNTDNPAEYKAGYLRVVTYLMDYPVIEIDEIVNQAEILQRAYDEITKTD